ncbi:sugar O-acetyltransferase [Mesorhizobium sp. M1C.F.Ca.ET.193.01.1.1]|uniref:sugar O-acetyltransferase n=1 Tax=unclassified Mesorhizobium TaxID=325217 RepID=UPI000FD225A9|nr:MULTISPECIES: sugar O-acetyltransferase [unclassified Mesorhizobium]TGS94005.1 sugar O-acetyltransferase [bacterium M00.F.Ca.ET.177.01.1.1]TGQ51074.1 sugar O-acetyltransferase [Mesorhizobium sp. M1C.F.Ca.ET.210.01.1.1]TGQ66505.1 sugar O-acetyltransferase [Mesorhizobium sp. M1C.F.Ca.ET.212.01.1.1]TGR00901.1 sugar O-acetyltransferase [Mesorhizobium sp. M1C.F.Ca.ET.204.01.1.1]TGR21176.1 sugar O-acetyltransferase [Mesorhizobium sp. M1C.F.Ca.ET.196.01.1.1]
MTTSERMKMVTGEWYTCIDPELEELRVAARDAAFEHNSLPPRQRGDIGPALRALLGGAGEGARIEAPFHCAYGFNLFLGEGAFLNAGCTILDTAPVHIGKGTQLGPNVQIYCAEHHWEAAGRQAGLEIAKPVTIGDNAWIGGSAVILAGVSIGEGAIVGAGAVVTRDVAANATAVGNPARALTRR